MSPIDPFAGAGRRTSLLMLSGSGIQRLLGCRVHLVISSTTLRSCSEEEMISTLSQKRYLRSMTDPIFDWNSGAITLQTLNIE